MISLGPPKRHLTFVLDSTGKYLFAGGNSPLIYILRLPEIVAPRKAVEDRSVFSAKGGNWRIDGGELVQTKSELATLLFGDPAWTDYDFAFETMTDGKADELAGSGVGVFRAQDADNLYSLLMGGYNGKWTEVNRWEKGRWFRDTPSSVKAYPVNRWHRFHIRVRGDKIVCTIDGEKAFDFTEGTFAAGRVGLRTWNGPIRFRKVTVTAPDGKILWDGLPDVPGAKLPEGAKEGAFVALFNGKDLTGWTSTAGANSKWAVKQGVLTCTGPTDYLFTDRNDYEDFHLRVEAKVNDKGNAGIYFRSGKPIVANKSADGHYEAQISTRADQPKTGSLFGLVKVDDSPVPPDTWFTYEVIAEGDRIRLLVNGKQTADYADPKPDRLRKGHLAFQCYQHRDDETVIAYRNVEIKELSKKSEPPTKAEAFIPIFNGKDLTGWSVDGGNATNAKQWQVKDGIIRATSPHYTGQCYLLSDAEYADFALRFEFQIADGKSHGAVAIRAVAGEKVPFTPSQLSFGHPMIALSYPGRVDKDSTGAAHFLDKPTPFTIPAAKPEIEVGKWHRAEVTVRGETCVASFDGKPAVDIKLDRTAATTDFLPGLKRAKGKIGFQINTGEVLYRNVEIKELPIEPKPPAAPADPFAEKSVWVNTGTIRQVLTVIERKGENFRARFEVGTAIDREVSGQVKGGKVSWLAKDVKAATGLPGGDNAGTLVRDKEGDRIDFAWQQGTASGAFTLRRQILK